MKQALAYFLTWTCHGTRLHGDERGTVDIEHNQRGAPLLPPNPVRVSYETNHLNGPPVELSDTARAIVRDTLLKHAAFRNWSMLAVNVRTTHVHVVVMASDHEPETVMGQFKAWSSRRLVEAGHFPCGAKIWTPHGSTRWINHMAGLQGAMHYVEDLQ